MTRPLIYVSGPPDGALDAALEAAGVVPVRQRGRLPECHGLLQPGDQGWDANARAMERLGRPVFYCLEHLMSMYQELIRVAQASMVDG